MAREIEKRDIRSTPEQRVEVANQGVPRHSSGRAGALLTVEVRAVVVVPAQQWLERVYVVDAAVQAVEAVVVVDADQERAVHW